MGPLLLIGMRVRGRRNPKTEIHDVSFISLTMKLRPDVGLDRAVKVH